MAGADAAAREQPSDEAVRARQRKLERKQQEAQELAAFEAEAAQASEPPASGFGLFGSSADGTSRDAEAVDGAETRRRRKVLAARLHKLL